MPAGRPTKLNEAMQATIVGAIQRGAYIETAAELAGIDKTTFYDWLKKGARLSADLAAGKKITRPESHALIEFSNAIKIASAQGEMRDVMVIDAAAQAGVWQAAAWKLERKHHDRWGRKVAVTDNLGGNFFEGMAAAWATALQADDDVIEHETPPRLNGGSNGSGAE